MIKQKNARGKEQEGRTTHGAKETTIVIKERFWGRLLLSSGLAMAAC